ncbi:hemicentin-1 [Thrips palmi]|uniref:Hemicentin-1 n=1 Tax=Thrips palmi TaxID=161013 RepID=A0A6P8YJM4_THRPL|nr:hemicentin-1 [Thrips palmi]XP_034237216.1 hemicentin-1 [Thrips palmi]XP_034237217.1 hemicentin-1 [Thrips palmi]XP_034237218.1 hemicentin-1 [Thrips palmi]
MPCVLQPGQGVLLPALRLLLIAALPTLLHATTVDKGPDKHEVSRRHITNQQGNWQQEWYSGTDDYHQRLGEGVGPADNNTVTNVTVQLGGSAFLHCRVRNMGERTVSPEVTWVRRRDWHILTTGISTYTNDERFQVLHPEGSDDWTLQIKYVQRRDNGTYECQVATGAGLMSHFVNLHIVVPEAFILGSGGEHHVDRNSPISLICIIEKSPTPPQYVFWYHNDKMINYDTQRGGITVETEPGARTQSRLTIRDASDADSGNYTCSASNTEAASIFVFVSEGDKIAAISRRKTSSADSSQASRAALFAALLLPVGLLVRR